tara:strand:+ start:560 stop:1210 length:651 start_codon:yes stop_codon:yes gene_type:complete
MTELNKRIITSFFLVIILLLSSKFFFVLFILLILLFYEIFNELFLMLNKIYNNTKRNKLYFTCLFTLAYLVILFSLILDIFVSNKTDEKIFLYFIIIVCISTDIGGFTFGKLFKGKKLTKISPNKTYSGLIGSYFLSLITSLFMFIDYFHSNEIFLFSLIISSISQGGDLFISFLKRKANFKDTGNLLPGHGGVLDRLDGFIFGIPFGLILFNIYG